MVLSFFNCVGARHSHKALTQKKKFLSIFNLLYVMVIIYNVKVHNKGVRQMKQIYSILIVVWIVLAFGNGTASANATAQYFVNYNAEHPVSEEMLEQKGAKVLYHFNSSSAWLIEVDSEAVNTIRSIPNVTSVNIDETVQLEQTQSVIKKLARAPQQANDLHEVEVEEQAATKFFSFPLDDGEQTPDYIRNIKVWNAWDTYYTGIDIKIAVIDTGIAIHHQDLEVAGGASFVPNHPSYDDDNGHGTHVAGIIGARPNGVGLVGIAFDADLYAVKVLDTQGIGNISNIIKGIEWATANNMDIINLSLYIGNYADFPALHNAIKEAHKAGIVIVGITGNSGLENREDTGTFPGNYPEVIATAAADYDYITDAAPLSSYGYGTDIAAPGIYVLSTWLDDMYTYESGTSMAAPHVTGVMALLKGRHPDYSNEQLRLALYRYTKGESKNGWNPYTGVGLLQLDDWTKPIVKTTGVTLNKQALTLALGEQQQLVATVKPTDASYQYVMWQSSNNAIVAVDKGRIIAKQPGTAIIEAITMDGYKTSALVTVPKDPTTFTQWEARKTDDFTKTWTISFSQPIDQKTVTAQNIYITNEQNNRMPLALTSNGTQLTIASLNQYTPFTKYTLSIKDLKSTTGTPLIKAIQMPFTIETK